jgi:ABC-type antimicrobial peptide transport system permease subunit
VAPGEPEPAYEIVGVVKDTKLTHLRDKIEPMVYLASTQERDPGNGTQFIMRARGSIAPLLPAVTRAVNAFSPAVNLEFRVLASAIKTSLLRERLLASLSAAFGVLAALLAAIGLYGLMSYTVARRSNEIGIRMAMGAESRAVVRMVLGEVGWLLAAGVIAGTGLSLGVARFARTLLFGLDATDTTTVALAVATLACMGLASAFVPARRAARVDPAVALRAE